MSRSRALDALEQQMWALTDVQPFDVQWQIQDLTASGVRTIGAGAHIQASSFSTRKVSVLLACLARVHRGDLCLGMRLPTTEEHRAGVQAGIMKNMAAGVELTLEDHLRQMMITSDNICTQLVFEAIGRAAGDPLEEVNRYVTEVGLTATVHREVFPRTGELSWDHSIEQMTVTSAADQVQLLGALGRATGCEGAAAQLCITPVLARFAVGLMRQIHTPRLGAETRSVDFAEKNGRGLRGLSQVGLALAEDGGPVAAAAVFAENVPAELAGGQPGRVAAYDLFSAVGRAVEAWYTGDAAPAAPGQMQVASRGAVTGGVGRSGQVPRPWAAVRALGTAGSGSRDVRGLEHRAAQSHPLAGAGKLLAVLALAERAEHQPGLSETAVEITASHRRRASNGPLRTLTGELTVSLADALALVVSTSDVAAALAVRDSLEGHGLRLESEVQRLLDQLRAHGAPLPATRVMMWEGDSAPTGDLIAGETSPQDLVEILARLSAAGGLGSLAEADAAGVSAGAAGRVLGWMSQVFEPAGLAFALPGCGPRGVPQWSLSAAEPHATEATRGWASVLITHQGADPISGTVACAAAYVPEGDASSGLPADVHGVLGQLGLEAYRAVEGRGLPQS